MTIGIKEFLISKNWFDKNEMSRFKKILIWKKNFPELFYFTEKNHPGLIIPKHNLGIINYA